MSRVKYYGRDDLSFVFMLRKAVEFLESSLQDDSFATVSDALEGWHSALIIGEGIYPACMTGKDRDSLAEAASLAKRKAARFFPA